EWQQLDFAAQHRLPNCGDGRFILQPERQRQYFANRKHACAERVVAGNHAFVDAPHKRAKLRMALMHVNEEIGIPIDTGHCRFPSPACGCVPMSSISGTTEPKFSRSALRKASPPPTCR